MSGLKTKSWAEMGSRGFALIRVFALAVNENRKLRFYFGNVQNRRRLDAMGQVKLAAAKEIVQKRGIRS